VTNPQVCFSTGIVEGELVRGDYSPNTPMCLPKQSQPLISRRSVDMVYDTCGANEARDCNCLQQSLAGRFRQIVLLATTEHASYKHRLTEVDIFPFQMDSFTDPQASDR
jgi:hypothetical protein